MFIKEENYKFIMSARIDVLLKNLVNVWCFVNRSSYRGDD